MPSGSRAVTAQPYGTVLDRTVRDPRARPCCSAQARTSASLAQPSPTWSSPMRSWSNRSAAAVASCARHPDDDAVRPLHAHAASSRRLAPDHLGRPEQSLVPLGAGLGVEHGEGQVVDAGDVHAVPCASACRERSSRRSRTARKSGKVKPTAVTNDGDHVEPVPADAQPAALEDDEDRRGAGHGQQVPCERGSPTGWRTTRRRTSRRWARATLRTLNQAVPTSPMAATAR